MVQFKYQVPKSIKVWYSNTQILQYTPKPLLGLIKPLCISPKRTLLDHIATLVDPLRYS